MVIKNVTLNCNKIIYTIIFLTTVEGMYTSYIDFHMFQVSF